MSKRSKAENAKGENWTQEELDFLLETVLCGNVAYSVACSKVCEELDRGEKDHEGRYSGETAGNHLWKLATGYPGYKARPGYRSYVPGPSRTDRRGTKFTDVDEMIIWWATGGDAKLREVPPDSTHIALLLGRSKEEVEAYLKARVAKGRKGLVH